MKKNVLLFTLTLIIPLLLVGQDFVKLSGIVTDAHNGKVIVNADVFIEVEKTGTLTNSKGEYVLYLLKGEYDIVYSVKGYEKYTTKLNITEDFVQLVELRQNDKIMNRSSIFAGWNIFNGDNEEKLTMKGD
ncbi:MAG: carboxypeptidase-like regulatory domain-containing protein [Prolixibacteraceae bacterium]|jgi:hypothetical protein|nr:carboxypeptidase-like regulatory domain-containing protein [Prolixibacteraceae bacterium]